MKYALIAVLFLVAVSASAVEVPNLEGSWLLSFRTWKSLPAATSKLLKIKDFDIRVGYASIDETKIWLGALSYRIKNLEKLGIGIEYGWGETDLSLNGWLGYNFDEQDWDGGIGTVLLTLKFGGGE